MLLHSVVGGRVGVLAKGGTCMSGGCIQAYLDIPTITNTVAELVEAAEPVPLESAFSSCTTSYDVSRMFSSMLQLINNGNVLLDNAGSSSDGCGVSIKLLQLERAQERFEVEELVPLGAAKSPAKKRGKSKR